MRKVHESITLDRVMAAVKDGMETLNNPGFCLACGEDADSCEPDARNYRCECCGEEQVFGAEEVMIMWVANGLPVTTSYEVLLAEIDRELGEYTAN